MKKNLNIKICLVFFLILTMLSLHNCISFAAYLDKIVCIVNDDIITQSDINRRMTMLSYVSKKHQTKVLYNNVVHDLIDIVMQLQLAKKNSVIISDEELDNVISNFAKSNNMNPITLKKILPKQMNINFQIFRENLREQLIINTLQKEILGKEILLSIKDEDIEKIKKSTSKIYNKHKKFHLIDIVLEIPVEKHTKESINVLRLMIRKLINNKSDTNKILNDLKEFTENKYNIVSIDLGWRTITELPELFIKYVVLMRVHQIVGPIVAINGLHLLKLLNIEIPINFHEISSEEAINIIYQQKIKEKIIPWLKKQRLISYIELK